MSGLWTFLIVAVIFGSISSVLNSMIRRRQVRADHELVDDLQQRITQLEGQVQALPALPPHEERRVGEIEGRIQALETIITNADEALEKRFRDAARDFSRSK